jgi:hypothetical protein
MADKEKTVSVARDFSLAPAGRNVSDGPYSGEAFRERILVPALHSFGGTLVVDLDGPEGYGSSFLEEAFGGLIRGGYVAKGDLAKRLVLASDDPTLIDEITTYIRDAEARVS